MSARYQLVDLLYLMRRLRNRDNGCPWDIEQTFESIAPHTLEEAYEVVDCIERGDYDHLREELGDLLFQVIYHSQMASEQGRFDFPEVIDALVTKLISRHPHVFPAGQLHDEGAVAPVNGEWVRGSWEERKARERAAKHAADSSALADIPLALPSLTRLQKLQKRASRAGLPVAQPAGILQRLEMIVDTLRCSLDSGGMLAEEHLGELLFVCVDLARQMDVDAERAGRLAGREFEQTFRALEALLEARGESLETLDQNQKCHYWSQLKQPLK